MSGYDFFWYISKNNLLKYTYNANSYYAVVIYFCINIRLVELIS